MIRDFSISLVIDTLLTERYAHRRAGEKGETEYDSQTANTIIVRFSHDEIYILTFVWFNVYPVDIGMCAKCKLSLDQSLKSDCDTVIFCHRRNDVTYKIG